MRRILGLDYPDAGTLTVDGRDYHDLGYPMREVGALLDAKAVHGGRFPRWRDDCWALSSWRCAF
jgi:ABC-2 type transport system ATP-binding protein